MEDSVEVKETQPRRIFVVKDDSDKIEELYTLYNQLKEENRILKDEVVKINGDRYLYNSILKQIRLFFHVTNLGDRQ